MSHSNQASQEVPLYTSDGKYVATVLLQRFPDNGMPMIIIESSRIYVSDAAGIYRERFAAHALKRIQKDMPNLPEEPPA